MKRKNKILIADDDPHVRVALRTRLKGWGFSVVETSDGLGVISQTSREGVDALILDHEMPLGQGREIARLIRNETDAPIIFLSGHDRETFRLTVMSLPDVYYLPKPLDAERLRDLLQSCLGSNGAEATCGAVGAGDA